ncbi:hypothetical protein CDD83_9985 [Cordyceps sp. RAO-2017]|nr:hypothetical protein CDD83_9985 [Cordyceps sp. RAO-2017]
MHPSSPDDATATTREETTTAAAATALQPASPPDRDLPARPRARLAFASPWPTNRSLGHSRRVCVCPPLLLSGHLSIELRMQGRIDPCASICCSAAAAAAAAQPRVGTGYEAQERGGGQGPWLAALQPPGLVHLAAGAPSCLSAKQPSAPSLLLGPLSDSPDNLSPTVWPNLSNCVRLEAILDFAATLPEPAFRVPSLPRRRSPPCKSAPPLLHTNDRRLRIVPSGCVTLDRMAPQRASPTSPAPSFPSQPRPGYSGSFPRGRLVSSSPLTAVPSVLSRLVSSRSSRLASSPRSTSHRFTPDTCISSIPRPPRFRPAGGRMTADSLSPSL